MEDAESNRLSHTIPDGWIEKGAPISWLPRSSDVTPLKFFVLGCAKTLVGSLEEVDRLEYIVLDQCFSTAGPRPGTGPWHQLYRAARGSRWSCHFSFL